VSGDTSRIIMPVHDDFSIPRRHFLISTTLTAAAVALGLPDLHATTGQQRAEIVRLKQLVEKARKEDAAAKIIVQALRANVHLLMGTFGNIAVLSGRDGKLLVDSGFAGSRSRIADALAAIGSDPIKTVVNTHWHFDHTDGNEWLHAAGATIIAHENTRKRLSTSTRVEAWDTTFPPSAAGAIPSDVVTTQRTLDMNGTQIALTHHGPAHTDGDLSVLFGDAGIIHLGDTFWNGVYPFIDYSTGGGIDGMIHAVDTELTRVTGKMIVIPGHGPVGDRVQLSSYRDLLATVRDRVAAMKKQGRTLDEVVAARPTAAYDIKWGGSFVSPAMFTGLVYAGV
jgi:glyoxylase-like metal-dependent hydrolase (beta-lactamase superfamily II)